MNVDKKEDTPTVKYTASTASGQGEDVTTSASNKEKIEAPTENKPALEAVFSRTKPKIIKCPFCKDYKGTDDGQTFRLHFFHHYKDRFEERV